MQQAGFGHIHHSHGGQSPNPLLEGIPGSTAKLFASFVVLSVVRNYSRSSDYLRGSMLGIRRYASNDLKDTFAEKCHRMPQERESFTRGGPSSAAIHLDALSVCRTNSF